MTDEVSIGKQACALVFSFLMVTSMVAVGATVIAEPVDAATNSDVQFSFLSIDLDGDGHGDHNRPSGLHTWNISGADRDAVDMIEIRYTNEEGTVPHDNYEFEIVIGTEGVDGSTITDIRNDSYIHNFQTGHFDTISDLEIRIYDADENLLKERVIENVGDGIDEDGGSIELDDDDIETSEGNSTSEDFGSPIVVDDQIKVTGGPFSSSLVSIGNNFDSKYDNLSVKPGAHLDPFVDSISELDYDAETGILNLTPKSGSATAEEFEQVFQNVTYNNTRSFIDTSPRNITFQLVKSAEARPDAVFNPANERYYEWVEAERSWAEARAEAETKGGYLATIRSQQENDFIRDNLGAEGWIGASDADEESIWRWVTGPEGEKDGGKGLHFFTQTAAHVAWTDPYPAPPEGVPGGGVAVNDAFNNWHPRHEPDNKFPFFGGQDYAYFMANGLWMDASINSPGFTPKGYIVEYDEIPSAEPDEVLTASRTVQYTPGEDPPDDPTVAINANRTEITAGEAIEFDGSGSEADDGAELVAFEWDFTGDGLTDVTGKEVVHQFDDPGNYTVSLTVTDDHGSTNSTTIDIAVISNQPPTVVISAPDNADRGELVQFDGTNSTDAIGITAFEWDFGDGSANTTDVSPTHGFAEVGTYEVILTVTNVAGISNSTTHEIIITKSKRPTIANFSVNTTGDQGFEVNFSSSVLLDEITIQVFDTDDITPSPDDSAAHLFNITNDDFTEVVGAENITYSNVTENLDPGNYTFRLTRAWNETDGDGGFGQEVEESLSTIEMLEAVAIVDVAPADGESEISIRINATDNFGNLVAAANVVPNSPQFDGIDAENFDWSIETYPPDVDDGGEGYAIFNATSTDPGSVNLNFTLNPTSNNVTVTFETAEDVDEVEIVTQPEDTFIANAVGGHPTVKVVNETGVPIIGAPVNITLVGGEFASGDVNATTNSTGYAVFDDLRIKQSDTYELEFDAAGATALSNEFDMRDEPVCDNVEYEVVGGVHLVTNAKELQCIDDAPNTDYRIANHINLTAAFVEQWYDGDGFSPIGSFDGLLEGDGNVVEGLYIDRGDYVGLFGTRGDGNAVVQNLRLESVNVTGGNYVGGLAGNFEAELIQNVSVTGTVRSIGENEYSAGFIARAWSTNMDQRNVFRGEVISDADFIGGLVGRTSGDTAIGESYVQADITVKSDGGSKGVGLIMGFTSTATSYFEDLYAAGNITDTDGTLPSSAKVGAISGDTESNDEFNNVYWDRELTVPSGDGFDAAFGDGGDGVKASASSNIKGLTTTEMQGDAAEENMIGFDFDDTWGAPTGNYPIFQWQFGVVDTPDAFFFGDVTAKAGNGEIVVSATEFGVGVPGVTIVVLNEGDIDDVAGIAAGDTAVTDKNGEATFMLNETAAGEYKITFAWDDDTSVQDTATVVVVAAEPAQLEAADSSAPLEATGSLIVHAGDDEFGNPVGEGAVIEVIDDGGLDIDAAATTNSSGIAIFEYVGTAVDEFTVVVSPEGRQESDAATVTIESPVCGELEYGTTNGAKDVNSSVRLQCIANNPDGAYILTTDIDLAAANVADWFAEDGFDPIDGFTGTLAGNGHTISGLVIDRSGEDHVGLFGNAMTGSVSNLVLTDVAIEGNHRVGGLAGDVGSDGSIEDITISGTVKGDRYVGGLIGNNEDGKIARSTASVSVSSENDNRIGGLIGNNNGSIADSVATGDVTGNSKVGGLVGRNSGQIARSYATGAVTSKNSAGGLVGSAGDGSTIEESFATGTVASPAAEVGGLIGWNNGDVQGSYWDVNTTKRTDGIGDDRNDQSPIGLFTRQLTGLNATVYLSTFDFDDEWRLGSTTTAYPEHERDSTFTDTAEAYDTLVEGAGTEHDPYRISTVYELQRADQHLGGAFILVDHIDASATPNWHDGAGFEPIGSDGSAFTGTLDGRGFEIADVVIDRPGEPEVGLFGHAEDAVFENLRIENITVVGDLDGVGGLAGRLKQTDGGEARVENTSVTGDITATGEGNYTGGLVGHPTGGGSGTGAYGPTLDNQNVFIGNVSGYDQVGGMIGRSNHGTNLGIGYVRANVSGNDAVGGIVGHSSNEPSTFEEMYFAGTVEGTTNVGAIVGYVGNENDDFPTVYWDDTVGPMSGMGGGTVNEVDTPPINLSSDAMLGDAASIHMSDFDWNDTWAVVTFPDEDYPVFQWELLVPGLNYSDLTVSSIDPTAGETITITATVTNDGDVTQDYISRLFVNGSTVDYLEGTIAVGEAIDLEFTHAFDDAGVYAVSVGNLDPVIVEASPAPSPSPSPDPAHFAVIDVDALSSSIGGSTLEVRAEVVNEGDESDEQTIELRDADGTVLDTVTISLAGGERESVTLAWQSDADAIGDYHLEIASKDDLETVSVTVEAPPEAATLHVTILDTGDPIIVGETLAVEVRVENVGDETGQQSIELRDANGTVVDSRSVTLGGGNATTITLTWATDDDVSGATSITVMSDDDSDSAAIAIDAPPEPAAFSVMIQETTDPVIPGEPVEVVVQIENTGDESDEQDIVLLDADGSVVDTVTVALDGHTSETIVLTSPTAADLDSALTLVVESEDDSTTTTVTVDTGDDSTPTPTPTPTEPTPTPTPDPSDDEAIAEIDISPLSLDFGELEVGETVVLELEITNRVTALEDLDIVSTAIVGQHPDDFAIVSGGAPITLAPGESHVLEVSFTPTREGVQNAQLRIISNAANEPQFDVWMSNTGAYIVVQEVAADDDEVEEARVAIDASNLEPGVELAINISTPATRANIVEFEELHMTFAGGDFAMDIVHAAEPPVDGAVYSSDDTAVVQYVQIEHAPGEAPPDELFDDTRITIRVDRAAVPSDDPSDVQFFRHDGSDWVEMELTLVSESDEAFRFVSDTPGFSEFVVTASPDTPDASNCDLLGMNYGSFIVCWYWWIAIALGLVFLIAGMVLYPGRDEHDVEVSRSMGSQWITLR